MTQFARNRGNVLDVEERASSARKCLKIIADSKPDLSRWGSADASKYERELGYANSINYAPSEPTLQWLRDMVSRYVTG